jgi:hypothetical protein
MNLPSFIDVSSILAIAALVVLIVQYIKGLIPDKFVKWVSFPIGIGVSFLYFYKPTGGPLDWVVIISHGILAAVSADTGYSFFSAGKSTAFSLPSKTQLNGGK